jgi:hypothetical protein
MKSSLMKPVVLGATAVALVVFSSTALAGSSSALNSCGQAWLLGSSNSCNTTTSLSGTTAAPQVQVNNASNGSSAYAIAANSAGGAPAISGGNTGVGSGIRGISVNNVGAVGIHSGAGGTAAGVRGDTYSSDNGATGVLGRVLSTNAGSDSAGVRGTNNSTNGNGYGVFGAHAGSGPGVFGQSVTGDGVFGDSTAGGSANAGVRGTAEGYNGTGVIGVANNDGVNPIGVFGWGVFTGGTGVVGQGGFEGVYGKGQAAGVHGVAGEGPGVIGEGEGTGVVGTGDGPSNAGVTGVRGTSLAAAGNGVVGVANASSNLMPAVGVYGSSTSSNGYAGWFAGDVNITGTLSKGAGAFRIDDPLDPAHAYLQHSFVESPDMKNVYDGTVTTDARGFATVKLPRYFQALNRDFRYQLTTLGHNGFGVRADVWEEISHNRFTIRTDKPTVKVSWQVTGIRRDPYANAHRIKVLVPKPAGVQGFYLHPGLYGKPATKAIEWALKPGLMRKLALEQERARTRSSFRRLPKR